MKTQITQATARPWQIDNSINGGTGLYVTGSSGGKTTSFATCVPHGTTDSEAQANAALIVQAVNQFDALNAVAEIAMRIDNGELSARDSIEMAKALSTLQTLRNNH